MIRVLWRAVQATHHLPANRAARAVRDLHKAIETVYVEHANACAESAYQKGLEDSRGDVAAAREEAFRAGMVAVTKRSDFREVGFEDDPPELRSVH